MPEPIFTITDTYFIKGRGLALHFFDRDPDPPIRVKVGDELELTSPDGEILRTQVKGVELIHAPAGLRHHPLGILVLFPPEYDVRLRGAMAQVVTEKAKS